MRFDFGAKIALGGIRRGVLKKVLNFVLETLQVRLNLGFLNMERVGFFRFMRAAMVESGFCFVGVECAIY